MIPKAINVTAGTVLATHVVVCGTLWTRFWGLMGKPELPKEQAYWITPCAQIHSFFMRFAFDAVFMDREGIVMGTLENIRPWTVSPRIKGAHSVLELPLGMCAHTQTEVGHQIVFNEH